MVLKLKYNLDGRKYIRYNLSYLKKMNDTFIPSFFISSLLVLSSSSLFLSPMAKADYSPRINSASDGYMLSLSGNNNIATNSVTGSNGKSYYEIGNGITLSSGSSGVTVTGVVSCVGITWGSGPNNTIPSGNAYHRLFMALPSVGQVSGQNAYKINDNLIMTVDSPILFGWVNISGAMCSKSDPGDTAYASSFTVQFPIKFRFYVNKRVVDGELPIPAMDLGGYVRAFVKSRAPTDSSWPIRDSTVPIRLASSTLKVKSFCKTTTSTGQVSTLNMNHGVINSLDYDSTVKEKIIYTCEFSELTKVKFHLDYNTDNAEAGIPLVNSSNSQRKIYSKLEIMDESTQQSGKEIEVNVKGQAIINVTSHLKGTNATAGNYKGSAWLIATYE